MNVISPKILEGDDTAAFYLKHFLKDLKIAVAESEGRGRSLPQTKGVMEKYQLLEDQGYGSCGTQALYHFYEEE